MPPWCEKIFGIWNMKLENDVASKGGLLEDRRAEIRWGLDMGKTERYTMKIRGNQIIRVNYFIPVW